MNQRRHCSFFNLYTDQPYTVATSGWRYTYCTEARWRLICKGSALQTQRLYKKLKRHGIVPEVHINAGSSRSGNDLMNDAMAEFNIEKALY
jgi:hypothetical protein